MPDQITPTNVADQTQPGDISGAATQPNSPILNLKTALRDALNEAGKKRIENNYKSIAPLSENLPGTIGSVVDMIKSGVKTPIETTFNDVVTTFQDLQKQAQFNPDQFRTVQGGVYDLKNNKWVVSPTDAGATGSKKTLSRTDVKALKLPVALVGTNWNMLQTQLNSPTAPQWFIDLTQQKQQSSITPDALNKLWNDFRNTFNSSFNSTDPQSGALNFSDF